MEPLFISESSRHRPELIDIGLTLVKKSNRAWSGIPKIWLTSLSDLVQSMNCYYSNLIEGHHTHIVDIERALDDDFSSDPTTCNLQLEAKSHILVQRWIDASEWVGRVTTKDGLCEIHRQFFKLMPNEFRWISNVDNSERIPVIPGELRRHQVQVGRHISISPGAVPRFLERFEAAYRNLGITELILAIAAAHHRFLWIHPFPDGNGRIARLMSDVMLRNSLDVGNVWSISRGLARNIATYRSLLANCDLPRRNDLDGRGSLSEEALVEFTRFFLKTAIDQIEFMEKLVSPNRLADRIGSWAESRIRAGRLPLKSNLLLAAVIEKGELPRRDVVRLLEVSERQARRVSSALIQSGALVSASSRAPLRLAFPAKLAADWLPGLFPEIPD